MKPNLRYSAAPLIRANLSHFLVGPVVDFDLVELPARYVGGNRNVILMSMILLRLFILRHVSEFRYSVIRSS